MPNNDIDVFDYLRANTETPLEIDYLTYAMFAYKKAQWIDHFKSRNADRHPTPQEIDGWITELSDYDFYQMRTEAADFFHNAAEEHLKDYIEQQKKEVLDSAIIADVRRFTSPMRHLGIALLMAIVAPIILGGIIFFASLFDKSFPLHVYTSPVLISPQGAPEKN
jgi:hypothetical protein